MAVRPAVVLAASRCLAVAAALNGAPIEPDPVVASRVEALMRSLSPLEPDPSWDPIRKSRWFATVFGGLVLVYTCNPATPISRVTVSTSLELLGPGTPRNLSDNDVLRAWAKIWIGMEEEGLAELAGPMADRPEISWRPSRGGPVSVAVRGVVY